MQRLTTAPNLALATLWCDLLNGAGVATSVQRRYAGSLAGDLPPDQTLPELWIDDEVPIVRAEALLHALRHPPHRRWCCRGCGELVEGPFDECWNCGSAMPV